MKQWIDENRTITSPFDIVIEGTTPGDDPLKAAQKVRPWAEAGATWWLEALWDQPAQELVEQRIIQGPPRMED
jgi:hypothetical protein